METIYTEIIDKYLNGELKGKELMSFEEKLKTDPQLQHELKLEEDLNKVILDEDVIMFRKEVIGVREEMQQDERLNRFQKPVTKWYLMAASIIILIGLAGYFYFQLNQPSSGDHLFAQYYSKYPSGIVERSDDINSNDPFVLGLIEYEEGSFLEASHLFTLSIEDDKQNFGACFFRGISMLETDSTAKAIVDFKTIINNQNNLFIGQAKWYLALAFIKTDKGRYQDEIILLLNSIIENEDDRVLEAKELMSNL